MQICKQEFTNSPRFHLNVFPEQPLHVVAQRHSQRTGEFLHEAAPIDILNKALPSDSETRRQQTPR